MYVIASASWPEDGRQNSFFPHPFCLSHHYSSPPFFLSLFHIKTFPSPTTFLVLHFYIVGYVDRCLTMGLHATICTHYCHFSLRIIAVVENRSYFSISSNGRRWFTFSCIPAIVHCASPKCDVNWLLFICTCFSSFINKNEKFLIRGTWLFILAHRFVQYLCRSAERHNLILRLSL